MKSLHHLFRGLPAGIVVLLTLPGVALAGSQIDAATHQVRGRDLRRQLETPALESVAPLSNEETDDIGPQFVIREKRRRQLLEASLDVQFAQTSNIYLAETDKIKSNLMITTAQVALAPEPFEVTGGAVGLRAGYRHQKFSYGKFTNSEKALNDMDFDVSTFFAQGRYLRREHWAFSAGVEYNRLLTASNGDYDEFYSEVVPSVGVDGQYKLTEKMTAGISASTALRLTRVDPPNRKQNNRVEEALTASLIYELTSKVSLQPFYRVQFDQYTRNRGRRDAVQTVGLNVGYALNKWSSIRVFANYEARDSSDPIVADYRKFDNGIGVAFQARF